jgi:DNA-binding transcriptional MocR family regulator
VTRVGEIIGKIGAQIDGGLLKPGERLLSVRAGAVEHGVSKNTMAEAYDRMVARGLLEAKQGSGYFVAAARSPTLDARSTHVVDAVDLVSLLREQLDQHYAVRVGDGRPPPSWMKKFELGSHLRGIKTPFAGEAGHGYGSPWGFRPLRERIALTLAERGVTVGADQILLTQGANHALDLVVRHLLEPGDTVLVDSPGYYPLFGKLKLAKVPFVGVRRLRDGPDLDDLAAKAAALKPKAFFTQSLAHNPTGGSISLPVAHRLLQLADRHGFHVVEDDPFADILPASSPRLAALDQLDRVIHVGTFSKTLSASLRVGFIAAKPALAKTLCDLKMLTVVSTSDYVERVVHNLIVSGQYLRHLRGLKAHVAEATASVLPSLQSVGIETPVAPAGGYYVWGVLPPGTDEVALVKAAAAESIFVAPGFVFAADRRTERPAMRLNIAYAGDPRFLDFIRRHL